jgi:UTP-glucose-1-phosphate uridylyltransferase
MGHDALSISLLKMQPKCQPTLLILAAGMGSRYGGLKQMDLVGPSDETIIDYSVYDALRAGFSKLVFVIRRDMEEPFRQIVGARFEERLPVEYVFQELDMLPLGFSVPPARKKPWGTGHAILTGADAISEPFGVINADDFYGANSFRLLAEHLGSGIPDYAMVGFVLRNTLSEFGSVARGKCQVADDGHLQSVTELTRIEADGMAAKYTDEAGIVHRLGGDETVSMNTWGFAPTIFEHLRRMLSEFLKTHGQDENTEFYIPSMVTVLISAGKERCKVLRTSDSWFGVTYRQDRPRVIECIRALVANGNYPQKLWT